MPRRGENIRKRKDGRWEARFPVGTDEKGRKRYSSVYADSYREVKEKRNAAIGKKASEVDGVISFNKSISRVHCRINSSANGYSITDLESANGTYVNRVRLKANQTMPIKDGDVIRLANSDFQVAIR